MFAIVLFIHLAGVAMLFAACGLELSAFAKLHRARTNSELLAALADGKAISVVFPVATVTLIASGIVMVLLTGMDWRAGWLVVAAALVIALSLIGPLVTSRRMQALALAALRSSNVLIDAAADAGRRDVVLNVAAYASTSGAVAILFLMSNKPTVPGALLAAAVATLVSVALGVQRSRRTVAATERRSPA